MCQEKAHKSVDLEVPPKAIALIGQDQAYWNWYFILLIPVVHVGPGSILEL